MAEFMLETTAAGRQALADLASEWQEAIRETLGPQLGTKEWVLENLLQWHRAGKGSYAEMGQQVLQSLEPFVRQAAEAIRVQAQTALQTAATEDAAMARLDSSIAQEVASGMESGDHPSSVMNLLGMRTLLVDLFNVSDDEAVYHLRDALNRALVGEPDLFGPSRLLLDQQRVRNALRAHERRKVRLRYPKESSPRRG
jgi:hypothetical protein